MTVVLSFEKKNMATNNSGLNSTYLLMSDGKGNEERGREQELTGKEPANRIRVENVCSIWRLVY